MSIRSSENPRAEGANVVADPICYLTSADDVFWSEPRTCYALGTTTVSDPSREVVVLRIDPPAIGQAFGLGGEDIEVLAVSPAHEGGSIKPLSSLPLDVHVLLLQVPWSGRADDLGREDLRVVGRGRLVSSREEAEALDRSMQRMNGPRR